VPSLREYKKWFNPILFCVSTANKEQNTQIKDPKGVSIVELVVYCTPSLQFMKRNPGIACMQGMFHSAIKGFTSIFLLSSKPLLSQPYVTNETIARRLNKAFINSFKKQTQFIENISANLKCALLRQISV